MAPLRLLPSATGVEATQELLWERGYVGTSPKAIQQQAGAGQGSMYHHFAGKPDLALAAIRRTPRSCARRPTGCSTARERLRADLRVPPARA